MSLEPAGMRRAAVLGTVTGARTFLAPAALALRGRLGKVAMFAVPVLATGEIVGDKLPATPPRVEGPGLVGRVLSGALSGRVSGGARGARVGAAFALAATYPSQALRSQIVRRTAIPDLAVAIPEDLIAATLAATASTEPRPDVDGPKTRRIGRFSAHQRALAGVAAGAVGTAAMTSAQAWVYGLTGGEGSEAPREVGEKILGHFGVKVRKEQRPALNTAMRALYGTSWGLPFGLAFGRGGPPGPAKGSIFGLNVWLASLVELPALGVAPPPWEQSPAVLAQDLAFHLVYGLATAAAYEA
ncbi:MAG: hypothetical protein JST53_04505 [Actinobacteria bacterium]|nr:hypothetical protein [Actinomycetota bacterium]